MRIMPFMKRKKGVQFAGTGLDIGGGGTTDYTDLSNKPQISGVTLTGNKTLADLGATLVFDGGTYNTAGQSDLDFASAISSYIMAHFNGTTTGTISYDRSGWHIGTFRYNASDNGYVSILAHTYANGATYHFGINNGVPFYSNIDNNYADSQGAEVINKYTDNQANRLYTIAKHIYENLDIYGKSGTVGLLLINVTYFVATYSYNHDHFTLHAFGNLGDGMYNAYGTYDGTDLTHFYYEKLSYSTTPTPV